MAQCKALGRANSMKLREKSQEKNLCHKYWRWNYIFLSENKYGNLTFSDWLTFCWPMRWGMPFAVSTFWMVFLTAFSPCLLPNRFLFWPWFSFHPALTVTLQTTKQKMHQKNWQICSLTNGNGKRWITISMLLCWRNNSLFTLSQLNTLIWNLQVVPRFHRNWV